MLFSSRMIFMHKLYTCTMVDFPFNFSLQRHIALFVTPWGCRWDTYFVLAFLIILSEYLSRWFVYVYILYASVICDFRRFFHINFTERKHLYQHFYGHVNNITDRIDYFVRCDGCKTNNCLNTFKY